MCDQCVPKDQYDKAVDELTDDIALWMCFPGFSDSELEPSALLLSRYAPEKLRVENFKKGSGSKDPPDKSWIEDGLESVRRTYWGGVQEEPVVMAEKNILRVNSREKHDFLRTTELRSVINAYLADAEIIPIEWLVEYNELRERWMTK